MSERNVQKLMERISYGCIHDDDDFTRKSYYRVCGFYLEIGTYPLSKLGFGTIVWDAALALCQYFEIEGMKFPNKKVIELGAGTGILSILVALLGGHVTITDQPTLLRQIERNVSFNIPSSFKSRVKICALSWGRDHTLFPSDYDYILGADIIYSFDAIPLILQTLLHLSNENTVVYFASRMTYGQITESGYTMMSQYFKTERVCRYEVEDINVYRMVRKTPTPGDWIE